MVFQLHWIKIDISSVRIVLKLLQLRQGRFDSLNLYQIHLQSLIKITLSRVARSLKNKEVTIVCKFSTDRPKMLI